MSKFDGDFKVGDIVAKRQWFNGYCEITKIERRFVTQEDLIDQQKSIYYWGKYQDRGFSLNLGDELPSWIDLKLLTKSNCQKLKQPYDLGAYDFKDLILAKDHIKSVADEYKRKFDLAKKNLESVMKFAEKF